MHSAGDVRIENVPDAIIIDPTDALVRVTRACICGSDLWPYRSMEFSDAGQSMGHEAIGVVEAVARIRTLTGGFGVHSVLGCVGTEQAINTAVEIARPGGAVGRVGVPHYPGVPPENTFAGMSLSAAALHLCGLTLMNFCLMCWRAVSTPGASSIA